MKKENNIKCPHCNKLIDTNEAFAHQIENDIKKKYEKKFLNDKKGIEDSVKISLEKDYNNQLSIRKQEIEDLIEKVKKGNTESLAHEKLKRKVENFRSTNSL